MQDRNSVCTVRKQTRTKVWLQLSRGFLHKLLMLQQNVVKSEFTSETTLLNQGSFIGNHLSSTLHESGLSLTYPEQSQNWPLLPSIQSHPLISGSMQSPIIKLDALQQSPVSTTQIQSPITHDDDLLESSYKEPLFLSKLPAPASLDTNLDIKDFSSLQSSGRLSPSGVHERSFNQFKNGGSVSSFANESDDSGSSHYDSEFDSYTNEIDFDSVCEALDNHDDETHLGMNHSAFQSSIQPSPSWSNESQSAFISNNSYPTSIPPTTTQTSKRQRTYQMDEDIMGFGSSGLGLKRCRRISNIVPNPRKPRQADYQCSKCGEGYQKVVEANSWWAVYVHECPSCHAMQVPRIDINLPGNAIELDPNMIALYGEGSGEDDEDDDESVYEYVSDEDEVDNTQPSLDQANLFPFGRPGELSIDEASKLVVLMTHARKCSGRHSSQGHADVCNSVKYMMLHVRDCPCTGSPPTPKPVEAIPASSSQVVATTPPPYECAVSWCLPIKKLLFHLTHCREPVFCPVCNPSSLPDSLRDVQCLNCVKCEPCL